MPNQQPPEKIITYEDRSSYLEVHSVFKTIQGEGPFAGHPAIFIRLAGCNLQCPACDTEYTKGREFLAPEIIVDRVQELAENSGIRLVVITGGEPYRQWLNKLFTRLIDEEFYIQVETNGTLEIPNYYNYNRDIRQRVGVYVVCSPKTGSVHQTVLDKACAFKYVLSVDSFSPEDGLPIKALGHSVNKHVARPSGWGNLYVYLQPEDTGDAEKNLANLRQCIENCMAHNYILQPQIHKIIGVP